MKYNDGKIKKEHHILPDFKEFLDKISRFEEIKRIIPGRISRQQKGSSQIVFSFSYFTKAGMKYNMRKGATAQEVFLICNEEDKETLKMRIQDIIKDYFG